MNVARSMNYWNRFKSKFDKKTFWGVIIVGMIIHYVLYSNQIVAYDGYWHYGSFLSKGWELSLGRFMLPFFDMMRGTVVTSFISTLISVLTISFANIIVCDLLKIKKLYLKIMCGLILITMPTFSLTLMYSYCADSYTFALLFSILSVYCMKKNRRVLGCICIIITLGIYQSYLCVTLVLYLIVTIIEIIENESVEIKDILKTIALDALSVILGMFAYYLLLNIILKVFHLNISEYSGGNKVLSMETIKNSINSIRRTYITFYKYYFTDEIVVNSNRFVKKIINLIVILVVLTNCVRIIIKNKTYKKLWKIAFIIVAIIIYPIVTCFIEIITFEREMNLLMSASMYFLYIIILKQVEQINKQDLQKNISIIVTTIVIWGNVLSDNATYVASCLLKNQMASLGNRILVEIYQYKKDIKNQDICIVGKMPFEVQNNDLLKLTFFDVSDISIWTWQAFLKDNIATNKKSDLYTTYEDIENSDEVKAMGIFPEEGSIKIINNIIVVKIGDIIK